MERLRGVDLSSLLARSGALEPEPAVSLFLEACDALNAAHQLGIVHRDIKPSNLFLNEIYQPTRAIVLKVCDFGIAKQLAHEEDGGASTELTRTGGIIGSPLYMSPEQAKSSKSVDARSDVYSLALTIHEALSGERPWAGRTSMGEIIVAVCTEDVPLLTTVAPWIDPGLGAVIAKALQRDANARYGSIAELAAALAPYGRRRLLTPQELVAVPAARRALRTTSGNSEGKRTGDAVSITANRGAVTSGTRRRWPALAIAGAAAVVALAGGGLALSRLREHPPVAGGALVMSAPPPPPVVAVTNATAAPTPTEVVDASAPPPETASARPTPAPVRRPKAGAPPTAAATATPAGSAPSTSRDVGRGFTATDLPTENKSEIPSTKK